MFRGAPFRVVLYDHDLSVRVREGEFRESFDDVVAVLSVQGDEINPAACFVEEVDAGLCLCDPVDLQFGLGSSGGLFRGPESRIMKHVAN